MKELLTILATLAVVGILAHLLSNNWRRTLQVIGNWGIYKGLGWFYDYPLWGFMVLWLGNLWGSLTCSIGAFVINFCLLVWYQKRKVDWLGVNILEEIKERGTQWKIFQLILWLLKKNDLTAFFVLSIMEDSFITTAFLRHGRFGKLVTKDYLILTASTLVSTVAWSLGMIVAIQLAKYGWKFL
jgi:hypothetical protein